MSCARRGEGWRQRMQTLVGNPFTGLLAVVGVIVLACGVAFDEGALVVMGPLVLVLSVVVSIAAEFSLDPKQLSVKFRDDDREKAYWKCANVLRSSLTRLAAKLADDPEPLVDEALDRAYVEWDGDMKLLRLHAICTVVRAALSAALSAAPSEGRDPPYREAIIHLHYEEDFEWPHIAAMLKLPLDQVRDHALAAGLTFS